MTSLAIAIVTDPHGWLEDHLLGFLSELAARGHRATVVNDVAQIPEGDIAFLLSLGQMVPAEARARNRSTIVVHGSALPSGKGWSPVTWQILEGETEIPMTLFEAVDRVDAGPIYLRGRLSISPIDLIDEIRAKQAEETVRLCLEFVDGFPTILETAQPQQDQGETFYSRRRPADSRLDPNRSLAEQFDLLRVSDPDSYPAFFDLRGHRFKLVLEHMEGQASV